MAGQLGLLLPQQAMGPSKLLQFSADPGGFSTGPLSVNSALPPAGCAEGAGKLAPLP
jgi:hypothetical protein